jgi:protein KRI1
VYDKSAKFYSDFDPEALTKPKKEKPMTLHDYHRHNLLAGYAGEDADGDPPVTYQQEQDALKKELVGSMHAQAKVKVEDDEDEDEDEDEDDEDDFLVAKSMPQHEELSAAPKPKRITEEDVAAADKDPDTFLSNFMASRAWLPTEGAGFKALDEDDSEDERRADEFEEAYNLRFEDPKTANEKLMSFARDVGKFSVRREEKSSRKRAREREQEKKEAAKREREEERARLRKLKIEEAEEKVNRIREAAGLKGKDIDLEQWRDIIEGDFDDDQWDREMKRRFGEQYYAENEDAEVSEDEEMEDAGSKKRKVQKPKWDDDIDIKDLVPDFKEDDDRPDIALSSEDEADGGAPLPKEEEEDDDDDDDDGDAEEAPSRKKKTKKDRLQEKAEAKRAARKQRMKIEEMVDNSLPLHHTTLAASSSSKAPVTGFRYRETSPTSFGLSARDILFADDKALNEYAGLKKLAAFRDEEKKRRDKKKFSKKARLRQWRKETFGTTEELSGGFERVLGNDCGKDESRGKGRSGKEDGDKEDGNGEGNVREGERKKKRRSKKKVKTAAEVEG